ncbi:hypothetical protein C7212DRAFT_308165 [Tuber magnatum]|uniref:Uncharacterized protein n=1 Tax=Tuber magnatum TaxID=42249 RepID=A0A317T3Q6_9PEZI|nr:hypothetical protein C7212DRAFT_308165 [Tuber magnatum]
MVDQALKLKKFGKIKGVDNMQDGLNRIYRLHEFMVILRQELAIRNLREKDVLRCLAHLYHRVSVYAHGNEGIITVSSADYAVSERAAIISLLKIQRKWGGTLEWQEVTDKGREVEYGGGVVESV